MASNFTNNVISAINIKNTKYNIRAIPFHATEAEWNSVSYIPKQGEFIVYDADDNNTSPRFKTGDGVTDVKRLPFTLATISEVQAYVNSWIGSAGHLKRVVLEDDAELPEVSEADVDTIYMKKNSESRLISDVFEEYMVINGAWEIIGNTRVDLSNYTTQEMVDEKIETVISEIPQNDWNAKEGEPGHVLNRTHYTESGRVELVAETTTTFPKEGTDVFIITSCPSVGDTIIVKWNGTEYSCVGVDGSSAGWNAAAFGNLGAMTGGTDTGEPFVVIIGEDEGVFAAVVAPVDGSTEATLSIYGEGEVVHKLDPKYIKDMYYAEGGIVGVLPETNLTLTEDDGLMGAEFIPPELLEAGIAYIVNWNGTEYTCTAQDMSAFMGGQGTAAIGNVGMILGTGDSGEPFVVLTANIDGADTGMLVALDGTENLTITVDKNMEIIHKLDPKYLPNSVPYIEGEGTIKTVLTETTFTGLNSNGTQIGLIPLIAEKTYFVNWNGTKYTCASRDANGVVVIGNGSYLLGTGNDEPFGVASLASNGISMIWSHDGSTEAIVSIEQDGTIFHKIDERLLPENIGTTYELQKSGSTIKLVGSDGSETSVTDSDTVKSYYLSSFGITATASELNILDGVTATTAELNYVDGVTSNIQTQLDGKVDKVSGKGLSTNDYTAAEKTKLSGIEEGANKTVVVSYLDSFSTNPVQGKVILENLNLKPGKVVAGQTYTIDGVEVTAGDYAEVFNALGNNKATGYCSHAEGFETIASNNYSHAEGLRAVASGVGSHAEGIDTTASGSESHAEGRSTTASGSESHAEGRSTTASGDYSHAEGLGTDASGDESHAEGNSTIASGYSSHAEGTDTTASGSESHAEGRSTTASGSYSHAEGSNTTASGACAHAEGNSSNKLPDTITSGSTNDDIIAAWETTKFTWAKGYSSHTEGYNTLTLNNYSHAEGHSTIASGQSSHAEGDSTKATEMNAHAEGYNTTASGSESHAEGRSTIASGDRSHAEGDNTTASGPCAHSEGSHTTASGTYSHVEGSYTTASEWNSHAEGYYTIASKNYQHVQGKYNIEDTGDNYAHIVGNGDSTTRSNAHTLDWDGNAWFAGDVYVGSTSGINKDDSSKKLATEEYVNTAVSGAAPAEHEHSYLEFKSKEAKMPSSSYWQSMAYGNGKFVAVERDGRGYGSKVAVSEDGINWVENYLKYGTVCSCNAVTYGNGKFVTIEASGISVYYSEDGLTWSETSVPSSSQWNYLTYGNGKFVAVGNAIAYSDDGITWTEANVTLDYPLTVVGFGDGKFMAESLFATVYSEDGINWNVIEPKPLFAGYKSIAYGNGKFVLISSNGKSAYSEDGINSTATNMPSSAAWFSVTYGNGIFVAVARDSNESAYSEDGITWTPSTLPISASWYSVTYGNGKFVAVASGSDTVAYSTDGINWKTEYGVLEQDHTDITEEIGDVIVESQKLATEEYVDTAVASIEHPVYTEKVVTEILPETTGTKSPLVITTGPFLVEGETYKVAYNSMDYILTCKNFGDDESYMLTLRDDDITIGDIYEYGEYISTSINAYDGATSITVSISQESETVHTLDEKYLPESVDGIVIRSSTEGSTKRFKLTVDDSGTITATEVT